MYVSVNVCGSMKAGYAGLEFFLLNFPILSFIMHVYVYMYMCLYTCM